jgi:hypothetical protein
MRLSFATADVDQLAEAARRLALAVDDEGRARHLSR